jgi:hypothetical protein
MSNSFIARSNLIDENMLEDPELEVTEDFFLVMNLCTKTKFSFSYEATCEFYWRSSKQDNSTFVGDKIWRDSSDRIRRMFYNKNFPQYQLMISSSQSNLTIDPPITEETIDLPIPEATINAAKIEDLQAQLDRALETIASMESTKFWKLRRQWFKLKSALGLVKPGE